MNYHCLKIWPDYFWAVDEGLKNFEVRRDDRGFQKGDTICLMCFDPKAGLYMSDTSNHTHEPAAAMKLEREITYVLTGGQLGIEPGYVVLGLKECKE
jgi:hypothetical protein